MADWLSDCRETRLDIDNACGPDIVASMTSMGDIGSYDFVYTSHALEHLYPYDLPKALSEFYRVLVPGGIVVIYVPDLESVDATEEVLFDSPSGPIAGLDLIYGHRAQLKTRPYMAHHNGFISETLGAALKMAGFENIKINRIPDYNLCGVGNKP